MSQVKKANTQKRSNAARGVKPPKELIDTWSAEYDKYLDEFVSNAVAHIREFDRVTKAAAVKKGAKAAAVRKTTIPKKTNATKLGTTARGTTRKPK
ncbi:MAG: hypothetical protein JWN34_5306 [Bryobacterales bacterium]|nr:hypothetical protein [Bryobacterales bacterium]